MPNQRLYTGPANPFVQTELQETCRAMAQGWYSKMVAEMNRRVTNNPSDSYALSQRYSPSTKHSGV